MAAVEAVLDIYELLESILQHLSPFCITRSMRVCWTWHALITRSRFLHNARILAPLAMRFSDRYNAALGQIPIYAIHNCPRYIAHIPYPSGHARQCHAGREFMGHYLNFGPAVAEHDGHFAEVWDEFATVPPCQAVLLRILREEHYAVVYVKDGVRVRHLREVAEGMVGCVGEYLGCERAVRAVVTGWVFEIEDECIVADGETEVGKCGEKAEMPLWT